MRRGFLPPPYMKKARIRICRRITNNKIHDIERRSEYMKSFEKKFNGEDIGVLTVNFTAKYTGMEIPDHPEIVGYHSIRTAEIVDITSVTIDLFDKVTVVITEQIKANKHAYQEMINRLCKEFTDEEMIDLLNLND